LRSFVPCLYDLGWSPELSALFEPHDGLGLAPARVAGHRRGGYVVHCGSGELPATVAGRLQRAASTAADLPAVGDWVAVRVGAGAASIHAVLPRRTAFLRRAASDGQRRAEAQVVAANVDAVLVVSGLDRPQRPRGLERYLAAAWESGASPAIVLAKADLAADVESAVTAAEGVAFGVPVHVTSAATGLGVDELRCYLGQNHTVALLGPSGAGKSTLANALLGEERQATAEVRTSDGRGRHTTTARELIPVPGGGLLLDTPGMRELGLWDAASGLAETFTDVAGLAAACRFADCAHETEPGCAVLAAVAAGDLGPERLASWRRLRREHEWLARRADAGAVADARRRHRRLARSRRRVAW
jgi:ribosome biogenesis GTPase